MQVTKANGIHIHCAQDGDPGGRPLVFSNSLGTDLRVWDRVVAELGGEYRIVRYDKRGHGLSDAPPAPYSLDDHVDDLAGLLDAIGVREALVVGLSVGGMIAQGLGARRPDLVRGLVLCDTAHKIGTEETWQQRIDGIERGGIAALADGILERWLSERFRAEHPEETLGWRHMLVRTPVEGYLGTCAAIRDADFTEAAKSLAMPTLCVCGSEDGATTPDLVRSMAEIIPGARFELVDGAGHLPCVEAPQAVADLIRYLGKEAASG